MWKNEFSTYIVYTLLIVVFGFSIKLNLIVMAHRKFFKEHVTFAGNSYTSAFVSIII